MSQENVEVARRFYEALLHRTPGWRSAALACLAPDVEYSVAQEQRPAHGSEEVRAIWERWLGDWDVSETIAEGFIDAGDHVVVTVHERARGRGSGIEIEGRYYNVLTVSNGRIVRKVEFTDRSEALEAVGLRE
jgi:ketosteroid isomerase-like protein